MKYLSKILIVFLLISILITTSCGTKDEDKHNNYDDVTYDISINQDNSLTAHLLKVGNEYTLTINGTGKGKSFNKKEEVPWNPVVKKITQVFINDGITSIGDYYFSSIALKQIILPKSVRRIEDNSFNSITELYSYNTEVDNAKYNNIYYYSENELTTNGNYFHVVNDQIVLWKIIKLLFIGNSFTYRPGTTDNPFIPYAFMELGKKAGLNLQVDSVVMGSYTLAKFINPSDSMGAIVNQKLDDNNDYDYIILQEQSTTPINSYNGFETAVGKFVTKVKETQDHAKIILYETWGSPGGLSSANCKTIEEMEDKLRKAYADCGDKYNLQVNYVGKGFTHVYKNYPDINLYDADERHPSYEGAYLSSCIHLISIFGLDITNVDFKYSLGDKASLLRRIAMDVCHDTTIYTNSSTEPEIDIDEVIENPVIKIAWYAKTATSGLNETIIKKLKAGIIEYLKKNNIANSDKVYLKSYSGNVESSCGAILMDGDVDVMVGWKSNVDTVGYIDYLQAYPGNDSSEPGIKMGNVEGRWIHLLRNNEVARLVFNYLKTSEGQALFS